MIMILVYLAHKTSDQDDNALCHNKARLFLLNIAFIGRPLIFMTEHGSNKRSIKCSNALRYFKGRPFLLNYTIYR